MNQNVLWHPLTIHLYTRSSLHLNHIFLVSRQWKLIKCNSKVSTGAPSFSMLWNDVKEVSGHVWALWHQKTSISTTHFCTGINLEDFSEAFHSAKCLDSLLSGAHTHHFTHLHINFRLVSLSFILDILRNKVKEWWALKKWYDITFIRGSVGWMTSKSDWPQQGARSKDVKLWSTKCHKSWWTCANCCEFVLTPINFHSLPSRF